MKNKVEINEDESWKQALISWSNPSIPYVVSPRNEEELRRLGALASTIRQELAFMKYPEFQTYMNLERIAAAFSDNPQRGANAVAKHEVGHRFCPFDTPTAIILQHRVKKVLEPKKLSYDLKRASGLVVNLIADMNINTTLARNKDGDIVWAYQTISAGKKDSRLWRVYGRSMELAWNAQILPKGTKMTEQESKAAESLARLFERDFFDRSKWPDSFQEYASIIGDFLEDEKKDGIGEGNGAGLDDLTKNIPSELDDKTSSELARKLAEIGSNGLPSNPQGLKEFQEIIAGFGQGDMSYASISFYEMLSRSYDVSFASRPFGRPRQNPFQPVKWHPSMGADKLDIDYSVALGGKIIPGVTTYSWSSRKREIPGGLEEIVPNLDLYLDSSESMPNPINELSLPVLAGFVAAKKAQRRGAKVRATNFSGQNQNSTQEWTRDLNLIYRELVKHYNGGTVFPVSKLLEGGDPKQVLIITDAFLGNQDESAKAIRELRARHSGNRIAIYALHPVDNADYLRSAGAEVIHGTSADIFNKTIGKSQEAYSK